MPVEQIVLDKFDGGFQPDGQPGALVENQWSQLDGFVFDRERKLRSQWALQTVSALTDVRWVEAFQGNQYLWLVVMKSDGTVAYAQAPSDTALYTTANAVTWTDLSALDTGKRPCGLVLQEISSRVHNALMIAKQGVADINFVYENAAGSALAIETITDIYPDDATPVTDEYGQTGFTNLDDAAIPTANVAAMWGDQLVLADVTVKIDATLPLDATNDTRGRNALWVSEPGNYSTFNPASGIAYVASQEATIVDIIEIDLGLLVFTTVADRTYDGVLLLRGSPAAYEVVSLRAGIGPAVELVAGTDIPQTGPHVALWPEVGSVVFAGSEGGIWHTEGESADRLDHYGPDRYPSDLSTDDWYVIGFREQVIVSRPDGVHALRVFEEDGAWTKLIGATAGRPQWMSVGRGSLYYVDSDTGEVRRYAPDCHAERGLDDGVELNLVMATRTLQVDRHSSSFWRRAGLTFSSPQGTGELVDVTSTPGSFDASVSGLSSTVNSTVAAGARGRVVVRGHGPSVECSVTATFTGDVVVEAVTLFARSGRALK